MGWFTFPVSGSRICADKIVHVRVDRSRQGNPRIWIQLEGDPAIEMGVDDYPARLADYTGEDAQALLDALEQADVSVLGAA